MNLIKENSKLSISSKNSLSSKRSKNISNKLLYFEEYAQHRETCGKLSFDIEKSILKFSVRGEKSNNFKSRHGDKNEIEILKRDIKEIEERNDDKRYRYLFNIILKNGEDYIFSFDINKTDEKTREKFVPFLKNDYLTIYKKEFQKLDIKTQKKICFIMKNKDLLILYRRLSKYNYDPERIFNYIRYLHPEKIDINLGFNKIQLSRDDEIIMALLKNFSINKLITSDCDIRKKYYEAMEKKEFNRDEFWNNFYNSQKEHKTYVAGEYSSAIEKKDKDNSNNKEINKNNLFEELEKDKYYYDNYESNYLNNDGDINLFKTLNNYSMNKMKEINYFSYSPMCINIYNNRNSNKNNIQNKKSLSSDINQDMEVEEDIIIKETNKKKRLSKLELVNKISQMKKEYEEEKNKKIITDNLTIKTLTEEIDYLYNLVNIINFTNDNGDDSNEKYPKIFLIKDLAFIYKSEYNYFEKRRKALLASKKEDDKIENKIDLKNEIRLQIKKEMNNICDQIEKTVENLNGKSPLKFLLKYAKYNTLI